MRTELKWSPESNSHSAEAFSYVFDIPSCVCSLRFLRQNCRCVGSHEDRTEVVKSPTATVWKHSLMFFIIPLLCMQLTLSEVELPLCWISWGQTEVAARVQQPQRRSILLCFFIPCCVWGRNVAALDLMRTELKVATRVQEPQRSASAYSNVFIAPCTFSFM